MPDDSHTDPTSVSADIAARRREGADIADETAASASSACKDAPPSIDAGHPRTKGDGSGTSETN